jgi:hypothetical protein
MEGDHERGGRALPTQLTRMVAGPAWLVEAGVLTSDTATAIVGGWFEWRAVLWTASLP